MEVTPDPRHIGSIREANIAIGGPQIIVVDGQHIEAPTRTELLAYLATVRGAYGRWADVPDGEPADGERDRFIEMRALPMRLAQYNPLSADGDAPAVGLLDAVQGAAHTIILGEPGSGKSSALERLAWVTATASLRQAAEDADALLVVPVLARLADFRGEGDLIPVLRRALNELGPWKLGDGSVRLLLWATNMRFMLLLDGLNEFERAQVEAGRKAVRGHLRDYGSHAVHLSCRTADFDAEQEQHPELRVLPDAALWTVQELVDDIAHWEADGASDVRDYLHFHLGDNARRVYEHLHNDERLATMARIPLFLWMFRLAAEQGQGELPKNRGELVRSFVRAPRVLGRVPIKEDRPVVERSLEHVAWHMQQAGSLQSDGDALYAALEAARGKRSLALDTLAGYLKRSGLLLDLGDERYKLLHQLVQEYGAAAHLLHSGEAGVQLPVLAQDEWWRETCILALWLDTSLHTPKYLFSLMGDAAVDLRVRVAAATILGEVGDPRYVRRVYAGGVEAIEPEMVAIPAGLATLGDEDEEADSDEQPACQVPVAAFELAVYPVTNAEFACFVEAKGYDDPTLWTVGGQAWLRGEGKLDPETEQRLRNAYRYFILDVEAFIAETKRTQAMNDAAADTYRLIAANLSEGEFVEVYAGQILGEQRCEPYFWRDSRFNQPTQPVVGVNWYEAMAYAAWLGRVTGKPYRLPSEAEWEWAARRNSRRYAWGDAWEGGRCNWRGGRLNRPNPVGIYPHGATEEGLHELGGNVYEWTTSLYRPYPYVADDGREEAAGVDGLRVLRGGSWYTDRNMVRCGYRLRYYPWGRYLNYGYRLARTLS